MMHHKLKKRKTEESAKETSPGPQPPLGSTENAAPPETEIQDPGKEQRKAKKRIKTAAKKKSSEAEAPFEPLVPETRITISTMEEATLFAIQSTEEQLRPDLDRDLTEIKAEARCVVPIVSENSNTKEKQVDTNTNPSVCIAGRKGDGRDGDASHSIGFPSPLGRKRIEEGADTAGHRKTSRTRSKRTDKPIGKPKGERDCGIVGCASRSKKERAESRGIRGSVDTQVRENQRLLRLCSRTVRGVNEYWSPGCPNGGTRNVPRD